MIHHKVTTEHLQRDAAVYIRQSSAGQVKVNQESYRVQKALANRAEELGWSQQRVKLFEKDQGQSASTPMAREDFDSLLQMIQDESIGIVLGFDIARLARNSIDITTLIHWCAMHRTLIGDQHHVYDPSTPEDSMVLGIHGVLAVSELQAIRKRLQAALDEKASRGELHHGVPRGYVVVDGKHLRKHPDARVIRVIDRVFDQFDLCGSVSELLRWFWKQDIQLPRPTASGDGSSIQWTHATYRGLIDVLKNPKYAGVYVSPRYQRESVTADSGKVKTRLRLSRQEEWKIVLSDHHPAYITLDRYKANMTKIESNAQRSTASRGAVNRGVSLLAGLIKCGRCGHTMQVQYSSKGKVSYDCRNGRKQRDSSATKCIRFSATELERQLSEQVLYAVGPAGMKAAELAAERLASQRESRRESLSDQLEHLRYEADLTRRRLDAVDPANRLVFSTLSAEWELNLQAVSDQETLLADFDASDPPSPTAEQRRLLSGLGKELETLWHDSSTDARLKQQVVRLLIDQASAQYDETKDEVTLWLKWHSGHHTQLHSRRLAKRGAASSVEMKTLLTTLRKIADDASISRSLNRVGIVDGEGKTWTAARVKQERRRHGIRKFSEKEKTESGWLSQAEAATRLQISPMSFNRLIAAGIIPVEGNRGLPQVICLDDLSSSAIQSTVSRIRSHQNAPLPTDVDQQTLLF